jgi:hypothetical protein
MCLFDESDVNLVGSVTEPVFIFNFIGRSDIQRLRWLKYEIILWVSEDVYIFKAANSV